jgi:hypothetical protein
MKKFFLRLWHSILQPKEAVNAASGTSSYCDTCNKPISSWIGSVDKNHNITRTCIPCCEIESAKYDYKWENNDAKKQVVEYNAYDKEGTRVSSVKVGYFTDSQIEEIEKVKQEIYK